MDKDKTIAKLIDCQIAFEAPDSLRTGIVERIRLLERRVLIVRLSILGSLSLASLAAVVVSFFSLGRALAESGFFQYFSLFADVSVLSSYWKEAAFSLVESLPFLSLALLLGVLGIFVWSGSKTWSGAREMMKAA